MEKDSGMIWRGGYDHVSKTVYYSRSGLQS